MTPEDYKAARIALGLTQGGLAEALGIERETVCRRERGQVPISAESALAIAMLAIKLKPAQT